MARAGPPRPSPPGPGDGRHGGALHEPGTRSRQARLLAQRAAHCVPGIRERPLPHRDDGRQRQRHPAAHRRRLRPSRAPLVSRWHQDRLLVRPRERPDHADRQRRQLRHLDRRRRHQRAAAVDHGRDDGGVRADLVAGRHRDRLRRQQPDRGGQRRRRHADPRPAGRGPDAQLPLVASERDGGCVRGQAGRPEQPVGLGPAGHHGAGGVRLEHPEVDLAEGAPLRRRREDPRGERRLGGLPHDPLQCHPDATEADLQEEEVRLRLDEAAAGQGYPHPRAEPGREDHRLRGAERPVAARHRAPRPRQRRR